MGNMKKTDIVLPSRPNEVPFLYDLLIPSMLSSFGGKAPMVSFDYFVNSGLSFLSASLHLLRSDVDKKTLG